jgi:hypothetical protein
VRENFLFSLRKLKFSRPKGGHVAEFKLCACARKFPFFPDKTEVFPAQRGACPGQKIGTIFCPKGGIGQVPKGGGKINIQIVIFYIEEPRENRYVTTNRYCYIPVLSWFLNVVLLHTVFHRTLCQRARSPFGQKIVPIFWPTGKTKVFSGKYGNVSLDCF